MSSTIQFITEMKLRELRRQRQTFRDTYRELRTTVEQSPTPAAQLRQLYDGLQAIKFGYQSLHPDVVNLNLALREHDVGTLSAEVAALWRSRLDGELASGERRAEFVYLFGALLEEWTRHGQNNSSMLAERDLEHERLLAN